MNKASLSEMEVFAAEKKQRMYAKIGYARTLSEYCKAGKIKKPLKLKIGWFKTKGVCPECGGDYEEVYLHYTYYRHVKCVDCDWEYCGELAPGD